MRDPTAAQAQGLPRTGGRWRPALQGLPVLLAFQALLAVLVLGDFLSGHRYFAFLDIAGDTYEQFTGFAMHMARLFAREGWSGWSFQIGLGAPVPFLFNDAFRLLTMVGGPDDVLGLRIWVYLLKLVLGGTFFWLLVRQFVVRREAALIAALLYSFCGYIVINGVWDPEANPYVFFPLVLFGLMRTLRTGDVVVLPLAIGATLLSGVFFLTLGVSMAVALAVWLALSERPLAALREHGVRVCGLGALGFILGSPVAFPAALHLLDSPRVAGPESLLGNLLRQAFQVSGWRDVGLQLGGLFHKDLFGSGSMHYGYMNYLEGPGFWVGMLPLLVLPQLWRGERWERRALLVLTAGLAIYVLFPLFRLSAFGFASPYYRATTLWPTLGLLLAGAIAFERVLRDGADLRLLAIPVLLTVGLLAIFAAGFPVPAVPAHVAKIGVFVVAWAVLLSLAGLGWLRADRLASAALLVVLVEIVAVAWPSLNALRSTATKTEQPFDDVTVPALAAIRSADAGVFRVEKTFHSVSEADAAAQDYMGVKSYYYHGQAVVDFHRQMDLMRRFGFRPPVNSTNWLAAPGDRYVVHSVLGVKYVISKEPLDWPGFEQLASGPGWRAYRNELALPLGVVHGQQVTRADIDALQSLPPDRRGWFRDLALVNAVVLDQPLPRWGSRWDLAGHASRGIADIASSYAAPALALQKTGLRLEEFRSDRLVGTVEPEAPGILVFSIPAYDGWSLEVDGEPAPLIRANFGMLATPVEAGRHRIELTYSLPGLRTGAGLGACGLLVLVLVLVARRRQSRA